MAEEGTVAPLRAGVREAKDIGDALAALEAARASIQQWMPDGRSKVSILHRLGLYCATLQRVEGTRICRDCEAAFSVTRGEQAWMQAKGYALPQRCRVCRHRRQAARAAVAAGDCSPLARSF